MQKIKDKLAAEIKALDYEFRVELPREIGTAAAMGDLKENAEYHAARERQGFVRARIGELQKRLGELNLMRLDQVPKDRVGLGSAVTLLDLDSDEELTYELVVPEVADLAKGLISVASPIGQSLLGKKPGDDVTVKIPAGQRRFEVLGLQTIHERPAD